MLVEFYKNNQSTTFIKSLVTSACLPIYDCIQDGDLIIEGCVYIYQGKLIKCSVTGYIDRRLNDLEPGRSYVNRDNSRFVVLDNIDFGSYHMNVSRKETCPNSYYDNDTHRLLGKYLRMMRSYYGIDLMSMYNIFDGTILDDIYISNDKEYPLVLQKSLSAKVLFVPIKYNTKYTIFVDSNKPVKISPIFRNNAGAFKLRTKRNFTAKSIFDKEYDETHYIYKDPEDESKSIHTNYAGRFDPITVSDLQFKKPYLYEGVKCDTKELYELQNYLGLLIQLDRSNTSSIVVLEGDKSKESRIIFNSQNESWLDKDENETGLNKEPGPWWSPNYNSDIRNFADSRPISKRRGVKFLLDDLTKQQFNDLFRSPKQITLINDNHVYAFNDDIIQYIVHHVITNMETIENNIGRVQAYLPNDYEYEDIWDDRLRVDVFNKFMANFDHKRFDVNGFIDGRVEKFLSDNRDRIMQ